MRSFLLSKSHVTFGENIPLDCKGCRPLSWIIILKWQKNIRSAVNWRNRNINLKCYNLIVYYLHFISKKVNFITHKDFLLRPRMFGFFCDLCTNNVYIGPPCINFFLFNLVELLDIPWGVFLLSPHLKLIILGGFKCSSVQNR